MIFTIASFAEMIPFLLLNWVVHLAPVLVAFVVVWMWCRRLAGDVKGVLFYTAGLYVLWCVLLSLFDAGKTIANVVYEPVIISTFVAMGLLVRFFSGGWRWRGRKAAACYVAAGVLLTLAVFFLMPDMRVE